MCVFRLLVCVWTVCRCAFCGMCVCSCLPSSTEQPLVTPLFLFSSDCCISDWWKYLFFVKEQSPFCTSNETNDVEKLADWLIVVVSAHAHKPKQLILCLLGAGLMVCTGSCCGFGGCRGGGTVEFWIRLIVWREYVNMKGEIEGAGFFFFFLEDSQMVNDHLLVAPHAHCVSMNVCVS